MGDRNSLLRLFSAAIAASYAGKGLVGAVGSTSDVFELIRAYDGVVELHTAVAIEHEVDHKDCDKKLSLNDLEATARHHLVRAVNECGSWVASMHGMAHVAHYTMDETNHVSKSMDIDAYYEELYDEEGNVHPQEGLQTLSAPPGTQTREVEVTPGSGGGGCPWFKLDFNDMEAGTYVHDEYWYDKGVKVTARKKWRGAYHGFTPINGEHVEDGGGAMVFDSAHPTGNLGSSLCNGSEGNADMGSPHHLCNPSGPGEGHGGAPTSLYSNCNALGNLLVVQDEEKTCPHSSDQGGYIVFDFRFPTEVSTVTLLSVYGSPKFEVWYGDGQYDVMHAHWTGPNGVFVQDINLSQVTKLSIKFEGAGSVAEMVYRFCEPTCPLLTMDFNDMEAGRFYTNEFWDTKGVSFEVMPMGSKGYAPNGGVMVFDSHYPSGTGSICPRDDGDPDLGSPNQYCDSYGPGSGSGGAPRFYYYNGDVVQNRFANCKDQGNLLIIQEDTKQASDGSGRYCPDDSHTGGFLTFTFKYLTSVHSITFLDNDSRQPAEVDVVYMNEQGHEASLTLYTLRTEGNGLYELPIQVDRVTKISVRFYTGGSIAELKYNHCPRAGAEHLPPPPPYIGCYEDDRNRAMDIMYSSSISGITECRDKCGSMGYPYAGLEHKDECFCGHSYDKHGLLDESKCNKSCKYTPSETCGGNWALSVYHSLITRRQLADGESRYLLHQNEKGSAGAVIPEGHRHEKTPENHRHDMLERGQDYEDDTSKRYMSEAIAAAASVEIFSQEEYYFDLEAQRQRELQLSNYCSCVSCSVCCALFGMLCVGCGTVPCGDSRDNGSGSRRLEDVANETMTYTEEELTLIANLPSPEALEADMIEVCGAHILSLVEAFLSQDSPNKCLGDDVNLVSFYFSVEAKPRSRVDAWEVTKTAKSEKSKRRRN